MATLEIEATITERGQTTVPSAIRRVLRVGKPGTIVFKVAEDGLVTLANKEAETRDPVVQRFLTFLENDLKARPDALRPVTAEWLRDVEELVDGVEVDLDAPLSDADE